MIRRSGGELFACAPSVALLSILVAGSCSGTAREPVNVPEPAGQGAAALGAIAALVADNQPPEFRPPARRRVGVGQSIAFGLDVIDLEGDRFAVELIEKPASATYDPITLTVRWTPVAADMPVARFTVRVTETRREGGGTRAFLHPFGIDVTEEPQIPPRAPPLSDAVEQLLTIHCPSRLGVVDERWPFDRMLLRGAELEYDKMVGERRRSVQPPEAGPAYRSFLRSMAELHGNPRIDPDAAEFDAAAFGDPRAWRLVTVRPRLDKEWQELRVVYQATAAGEDVFAMFRFRPVSSAGDLPDGGRRANNEIFSRLAFEHFFDDSGALRAAHVRDRAAHARAVADFVDAILGYRDQRPFARGHFISLPHGARLGGGSLRDADGNYLAGDGWAWGVMRPLYHEGSPELAYGNVGIPGYVTALRASADGATWEAYCPERFDPALCLSPQTGFVGMPWRDGAALVRSPIDATHLFVEHKEVDSVAELDLRDPRRDLHEENSMSCSQCHVRAFGVRDLHDRAAVDPRAGLPRRANKSLPPSFFVLVPTARWEPFAIDLQYLQECLAKEALSEYLQQNTALTCPLAPGAGLQ